MSISEKATVIACCILVVVVIVFGYVAAHFIGKYW